MAVLLLRFDAPLQSWGVTEKLKDHHTDLVPSKSGVIGMIASAEGRKRDEDISDLVDLRFIGHILFRIKVFCREDMLIRENMPVCESSVGISIT